MVLLSSAILASVIKWSISVIQTRRPGLINQFAHFGALSISKIMQRRKPKPKRLNGSTGIRKVTEVKSGLGEINLYFREFIAVSLYHFLLTLGPLSIKRILQQRPHSLAISAVSLRWTLIVTGTLPHLAVRIAESRLQRENVPHPLVSVLLNLVCRSLAIYWYTERAPDLQFPWKRLMNNLPLDLLRTSAISVAMLVVPVLLQVNRIRFPRWVFLLLLIIPANDEETSLPGYQPITYYLLIHIISGVLAGRWMHWSFPDDPGPKRVAAARSN